MDRSKFCIYSAKTKGRRLQTVRRGAAGEENLPPEVFRATRAAADGDETRRHGSVEIVLVGLFASARSLVGRVIIIHVVPVPVPVRLQPVHLFLSRHLSFLSLLLAHASRWNRRRKREGGVNLFGGERAQQEF